MAVAIQICNRSRIDIQQGITDEAQIGRGGVKSNGVFHGDRHMANVANTPSALVQRYCHAVQDSTVPMVRPAAWPSPRARIQNGQKIGMKITPSTQKIRFKGKPTLTKSMKR